MRRCYATYGKRRAASFPHTVTDDDVRAVLERNQFRDYIRNRFLTDVFSSISATRWSRTRWPSNFRVNATLSRSA